MQSYTRSDFEHSPMIVFYETTRACDLLCRHCRACAQAMRDPGELTTSQAKGLIEELTRFPKRPMLVLTGGDPLKRHDVFELIHHAVEKGLQVAMTPSATPLVTSEAIGRLKEAGLHRLAVSLDGADAATHDGFRRVAGSFQRTLEIVSEARMVGLPVQINTTIGRHNLEQLDAIAELLSGMDIVLWSVFFLIPTGRALADQRISAEECEEVFEKLYQHSRKQPYAIKTTEAPHYRRFVLEKKVGSRQKAVGREGSASSAYCLPPTAYSSLGTNDGKGILFVSHTGEIYPSGFLPIRCGRFPGDSVVEVYQKSPLFRSLRDGDQLQGKCGECEYRHVCGGSRARAYAVSGEALAAEPDCAYQPVRRRAGVGREEAGVGALAG